MEERNWEDTYRTGSTHPPKSHRGLIASLLIPVILISGFIGLLAGLKIRFCIWEKNVPAPVAFSSQGDPAQVPTMCRGENVAESRTFSQGFTGEDVSDLWQNYYSIPQGVLITQADADTGLCRGDILLFLEDQRITGIEKLTELLKDAEEELEFVIYRGGIRQKLTLGE